MKESIRAPMVEVKLSARQSLKASLTRMPCVRIGFIRGYFHANEHINLKIPMKTVAETQYEDFQLKFMDKI